MTDNAEEKILDRAREIMAETGKGLVEAMNLAAMEAERAAAEANSGVANSFTITLHLKPKVARWVVKVFGGHAEYSIEQRLAAFLETVLNRKRVEVMRLMEEAPEIPKGANNPVTMRRDQFLTRGGEGWAAR